MSTRCLSSNINCTERGAGVGRAVGIIKSFKGGINNVANVAGVIVDAGIPEGASIMLGVAVVAGVAVWQSYPRCPLSDLNPLWPSGLNWYTPGGDTSVRRHLWTFMGTHTSLVS